MSEQIPASDKSVDLTKQQPHGRSLFWPIALIATGSIFLLANLNLLPQPDWRYALGFWPLLLIFIGLDILVTRARAPLGTFLSLVVSLSAVGVLAYLLFAGANNTALRSLLPEPIREEVPFSVPVGSAETAEIELDLSNYTTTLTGLADDESLVAGTIWTTGDLLLDVDSDESHTTVTLGEESAFTSALNPSMWFTPAGEDVTWNIGLTKFTPTDLRIEAGNGSVSADLSTLRLTNLRLDVGNGRVSGQLPGGTYAGQIDGGNGSLQLLLPAAGRQELEIEGGNGALRLELPPGVMARVEFNEGNGRVNVDSRFELVAGDNDEGVYETPGYSEFEDGIFIDVSTGNGSLSITQP